MATLTADMKRPILLIAAVAIVAVAAFAVGRATEHSPPAAHAEPGSYRAGREDAFSGFDGGWILGDPYIVILGPGGRGITYKFARRWPLLPGREYRSCRRDFICSRPAP